MGPFFLLLLGVCGASAQMQSLLDPEIRMNTPQIIQRWGYPVEIHTVQTPDGYMIDLHRIPFGKNGDQTSKKPVIYMQHCFMCDSSVWTTNLPEQSAAFIFADAGFDVWLGNVRGNTYGMKHTTLNPQMPEFWKFSFDEHSSIDLPAQIDYVLQKTQQSSLNYIGHSQGTLMMFTHLSEDPTFAQKIENFFALAPIGTMNNVKGLFLSLAKKFDLPLDQLFSLFGAGEFKPRADLMNQLKSESCGSSPLCENLLFLISGPPSAQFNSSRLPVYLSHTPAPVSTQNMIHFLQLINSLGVVPKFDFEEPEINIKKYGQPTPPLYDYSKVNTNTHLFWGDLDFLSDMTDIQSWLLPHLNKQWLKGNTRLQDFNHMDFVWGLKAARDVYGPILQILKPNPGNDALLIDGMPSNHQLIPQIMPILQPELPPSSIRVQPPIASFDQPQKPSQPIQPVQPIPPTQVQSAQNPGMQPILDQPQQPSQPIQPAQPIPPTQTQNQQYLGMPSY